LAAFVERQLQTNSRPTVKLRLAALRMLFDWMVVGQVMASNPAHAVRGPKYTQKKEDAGAHAGGGQGHRSLDRRSDEISLDEVEKLSI
jgi:hypothetical protein